MKSSFGGHMLQQPLDSKTPDTDKTVGDCETKNKLLFAYHDAAQVYTGAVLELSRSIGGVSRDDFRQLRRAAAAARALCVAACRDFETHKKEHGC
jgi:hypothetical protein